MNKKMKIRGGVPLCGTLVTQGAKNAALPVMAASLLLRRDKLTIYNVPDLRDIVTMAGLLRELGAEVNFSDHLMEIAVSEDLSWETPVNLVRKMRASSLVLGPLLARCGRAVMPLPGGCAIGSRPLDLHLKGLARMGAEIDLVHGAIHARAKGLKGCRIYLDFPSVGATENLLMAAVLAKGETTLENAAREPEVVNLANALRAMGAIIKGEGTGVISIEGTDELHAAESTVIPDRIAACTYILAGVITNGEVIVKRVIPQHFDSLIAKLEEANVHLETSSDSVAVFPSRKELKGVSVKTLPYPGFPTDVQSQLMATLTLAGGTSIIKETVFESRFLHVSELKKMGADIELQGNTAIINGVNGLRGADVTATDLRAGAALILAGLAASDETSIYQLGHIRRGYENIDGILRQLGADISLVDAEEQVRKG